MLRRQFLKAAAALPVAPIAAKMARDSEAMALTRGADLGGVSTSYFSNEPIPGPVSAPNCANNTRRSGRRKRSQCLSKN
jgi:hypothetical protein